MPGGFTIAYILLYMAIILIIAATILGILVAPNKASAESKAPFINRFYAHRGLYAKDQSIPENSLAAFAEACRHGYGIELDIQLTKDGKIVVAHDNNVARITGVEGIISEMTYSEISSLSLYGTEQHIPLFTDVLNLVDGRVPLIIEFKTGERKFELCEEAFALLDSYEGDFCVESFDPAIVRWFRYNRPNILRGQLSMPANEYNKDLIPLPGRFFMSRCLFGFLNRPHFIAYKLGKTPLPVKFAHRLGAIKTCWTSHSPKDMADNDMVIFEFYEPLSTSDSVAV